MAARKRKKKVVDVAQQIREAAEADLFTFARIVCPERLYGDIHKEAFKHLEDTECPNSLLLLPRGHMKSHVVAVWAAWWITKHPEVTILYVSATSSLAEAQLYAIKNILTSNKYREYWPEMVNMDEGKREKWSSIEIAVDHPKRREEGVRDMTVLTAGLTTTTAGKHADVIIADDVVVPENAYTEEGRRKVAAAMSQMASILNTGGMVKACGTRYHPNDQYAVWKAQKMPTYDEDGVEGASEPLWNILERTVETNGVFLWPRGVRDDGKAFGFDRRELNRISAMYTDRTQFYAQYYNDPNDPESQRISTSNFQYYDQRHVKFEGGDLIYRGRRLRVYAAVDFAYSLSKKADYSAIIVIGVDYENNIYVLDIDRFKTDKIQEYYNRIERLHTKWEFKKIRTEVTAAQSIIANDLKDRISESGRYLKVEEHRPTRHMGSKEERMNAVLEPRYNDMKVYHYKGGYVPALEEELRQARPKHDDLKDCLASAMETAKPPPRPREQHTTTSNVVKFNRRFGGRAFRG